VTTFSIQSFGCRVNQAEAFSWVNDLQENGLVYVKDHKNSDVVLINTCTLTSRADRDVRSFIRKITRENPDAGMILTGCYVDRVSPQAEEESKILRSIPNADKEKLVKQVLSLYGKSEIKSHEPYRSRALIKVQDGCDYLCTFCIIPSVRGQSVSTAKARVIHQIKDAVQKGYSEIVLTGVHVCLYGNELHPKLSLLDLLKEIEDIKGLGRLRLSSLDPRFLKGDLLDFLVSSKKICPHFHLSLQYGSDAILQKMGRNIRTEKYRKIAQILRSNKPEAGIGADIIVGFPGEKDKDFEETYRFLDLSPLTYFHVFSYSARPGTPAADWKQVNDRVKKERTTRLRDLSEKKNWEFRRSFIGKELEAVVIKKQGKEARVLTGNFIEVRVPACPVDARSLVRIKITDASSKKTVGEIA